MAENQTLHQTLYQVMQLVRQARHAEAHDLIVHVLRLYPFDADVWYTAHFAARTPDQKANALRCALAIDPAHSHAQEALQRIVAGSVDMPVRSLPPNPLEIYLAARSLTKPTRTDTESHSRRKTVYIVILAGMLILFTIRVVLPLSNLLTSQHLLAQASKSRSTAQTPIALATRTPAPIPASPTVSQEPVLPVTTSPNGITPLPFRVIDAEYSRSLERLVMISEDPNAMHVYDPLKQTDDATINLSSVPLDVTVSLDGRLAAVSYGKTIAIVDLDSGATTELDVSVPASDLILPGDGRCYFVEATSEQASFLPERLDSVEVETAMVLYAVDIAAREEEIISASDSVHRHLALYYNGSRFYWYSYAKTFRFNIEDAQLDNTPHDVTHYESCGAYWFSPDGMTVFSRCGDALRTSMFDDEDMIKYAELVDTSNRAPIRFQWVTVAPNTGRVLALHESSMDILDYETLAPIDSRELPLFTTDGDPSNGRWVFVNSSETHYFVIVQAARSSGLMNDFGLIVSEF